MNNYIIYVLINNINNKLYVGQTGNINARMNYYKNIKNRNKKTFTLVERAIRKYGWENFTKIIIEDFDAPDELDRAEIFWIEYLQSKNTNNGYNIATGGINGNRGLIRSIKSINNIRNAAKKGEKSPVAIFSNDQIKNIRKLYTECTTSLRAIGRFYNADHHTIIDIVNNKSYYDKDYFISSEIKLFYSERKHSQFLRPKKPKMPKKDLSGANNPGAKFSMEQIKEIREKFLSLNYSIDELAEEYNFPRRSMFRILYNKSYKDPLYIITDIFLTKYKEKCLERKNKRRG